MSMTTADRPMKYELIDNTRVSREQIAEAHSAGLTRLVVGYQVADGITDNSVTAHGLRIDGRDWDDRFADSHTPMAEQTWAVPPSSLQEALKIAEVPAWAEHL